MAKKRKEIKVSFLEFFSVWADHKGWIVPDIHVEIVNWLQYRTGRTAVLQVWRGAAKSTIVGCYVAWRLLTNPEYRFIVLSASDVDAWKMSADAQHIIDTHPFCVGMKGDRVWQSTIWSVEGNTDPRNSSVYSKGVMGNITGARADEIILDDIEVPRNVQTEETRNQMRMRIDETTHILVPGGKKLFVGTPHTFNSIYPEMIDKGADSLFLPLFDENGRNRWPERFTPDEIAYRRSECVTEGRWLSQYMLCPVPTSDARLNPSDIAMYDFELDIRRANGDVSIWAGNERIVGCSAYWDVAIGKAKSDDSVLSVIFTDNRGFLYWELAAILEGGLDRQCQQIRELVEDYCIPSVCVETNGPGGFVPAILRKHLAGLRCGVTQFFSRINKAQRILDAFEPALSGGFLFASRKVMEGKMPQQMRSWTPEMSRRAVDDILDSGAGAIHNTPVRIGGNYHQAKELQWDEWRPNIKQAEVQYSMTL